MKKIYFVSIQDDDVGEVEGFFDEAGEVLGTWCLNDADWRSEYFGPFLTALGYKEEEGTLEQEEKLKKYWLEY